MQHNSGSKIRQALVNHLGTCITTQAHTCLDLGENLSGKDCAVLIDLVDWACNVVRTAMRTLLDGGCWPAGSVWTYGHML